MKWMVRGKIVERELVLVTGRGIQGKYFVVSFNGLLILPPLRCIKNSPASSLREMRSVFLGPGLEMQVVFARPECKVNKLCRICIDDVGSTLRREKNEDG